MKQKLKEAIGIPCEEFEKDNIVRKIREYLKDKTDYVNGNIKIVTSEPEEVIVVLLEGCSNIDEIRYVLTH